MDILVTGGTGFIGSNLCKKLLDEGHKIYCMDNNFTGDLNNVKDLMNHDRFNYIYHDVIHKLHLTQNIDQVYHLACPASPPKYQADPIYTMKTCFLGTLNVLNFALEKQASFLLASTSEIYGEPTINPQHEQYRGNVNTTGIRSCYDEGKRICETLVSDFHRKYKLNTHIARIFNTYGPKMNKHDGRVVSNFINQALTNKNITIYGDGSQTRSFCYIEDLLNGLIKLMNSNYVQPINIGNPNEITILQLSQTILTLTNSKSQIVFKDLPLDDPTNRKPDITKAIDIIEWEPIVDLNKGLLNTIDYFMNY
tara:strand:+ start:56 stop:982 length:927 start_codon:yes stop_codon:yes gene_type:complete